MENINKDLKELLNLFNENKYQIDSYRNLNEGIKEEDIEMIRYEIRISKI